MGLVITPQAEINKYFESPALSQSALKKLLIGIDGYLKSNKQEKELYYTEKGHFIIGSAVDTILTGEDGEFDKQYYVSELEKKPSDVEMSIIQMVFDSIPKNDFQIYDLRSYETFIDYAITQHNWQSNWKLETKINKIIDIGTDYFEDLKKGFGKQILTINDKKLIDDIVISLRSNAVTNKYFDRNAINRSKNIEVRYQVPIYFLYKDVNCKALLDIVVIETMPDDSITIQVIDLKTMAGNTLHFLTNLKKFRYDLQASFYTNAITTDITTFEPVYSANKVTLLPFLFIVESNTNPGQPLVYVADNEILEIGKKGKEEVRIGDDIIKYAIKGFDELLDTYIYQSENDWLQEKVITDNNGVLHINWNGIVDEHNNR